MTLQCNHPIAQDLYKKGYECHEIYYEHGQKCYKFTRDPWEKLDIVIRLGEYSTKFVDYCADGNVGQ